MHTYRVQYTDGKKIDIKAEHYSLHDSALNFFVTDPDHTHYGRPSATISSSKIVSIIRLDMLVDSITNSAFMPEIVSGGDETVDIMQEALFTEEDKVPFTQEERKLLVEALKDTKRRIFEEFHPNEKVRQKIEARLDELEEKVAQLSKFDWKRLLVTVLIAIAVDLGFGTIVPLTLLEILKETLPHTLKERLPSGAGRSQEQGEG